MFVLDHKHKVLGMNLREGQVEYFVKMFISLLSSMQFQCYESIDGSQSQVFCCYFVDYVIKGYSVQDHIQVGSIVQKIRNILKGNNLSVNETCVHSDNSIRFDSQYLVPFLFHFNTVSYGPTTINWSVFTETKTY